MKNHQKALFDGCASQPLLVGQRPSQNLGHVCPLFVGPGVLAHSDHVPSIEW